MSIPTGSAQLNELPVAALFDDQSRLYATRPTGTPVGEQVPPSVLRTHLNNYYQPSGTYVTGTWTLLQSVLQPSVVDGRLSLASGTAVTTTDQTAKTSIWYNPYVGTRLGLYDGSVWQIISVNNPVGVAVPSVSGTPFDIFGYSNSGALALETVNWTNGTTRATALTTQNGILVKSGDATRRYLGTGRTTSVTGQCEDSRTKRFLWNYYNRVTKSLNRTTGDTSWTYATDSWRQANANAANQVEIVAGVVEDEISLRLVTSCTSSGAAAGSAGIGEDVTNAPHADAHQQGGGSSASGWYPFCSTLDCFPQSIGYHYYAWLEFASAATITFYGGTSYYVGGLHGSWKC